MGEHEEQYQLFICAFRGGVLRDVGKHTEKMFANEPDAIAELVGAAREDVLPSYDEIVCTVMREAEVVHKEKLRRVVH